MTEVHIIRHAKKGPDGQLTEEGIEQARRLAASLPQFARVFSSDSPRTKETAKILTGFDPEIDTRAGFYMASPEKSDAINMLAAEQGLTFLEALQQYDDTEVHEGVSTKATELNELIAELFKGLREDEKALIVSHDLSISPAMAQRGIPLESIDSLGGYIIQGDGQIRSISL